MQKESLEFCLQNGYLSFCLRGERHLTFCWFHKIWGTCVLGASFVDRNIKDGKSPPRPSVKRRYCFSCVCFGPSPALRNPISWTAWQRNFQLTRTFHLVEVHPPSSHLFLFFLFFFFPFSFFFLFSFLSFSFSPEMKHMLSAGCMTKFYFILFFQR